MSTSDQPSHTESWPRKLNKALIAIGVIAFGLIVTDRVLEAFRADDLPMEEATLVNPPGEPQPVSNSAIAEQSALVVLEVPEAAIPEAPEEALAAQENMETAAPQIAVASTGNEQDKLVELESMFGSRVVFVSAAEPAYLVTADERRFDVGSEVDEDTTLAGITEQEIFFKNAGDLIVISLPEPTVQ